MGRLSLPASRLTPPTYRVHCAPREARGPQPGPQANPLKSLYKTARWRQLRLTIFLRDLYTCQMCGKLEGDTSRLVADHIKPHRGNEALFWDEANLQTLCASPCHSLHKQRQEQDSRQQQGVWN